MEVSKMSQVAIIELLKIAGKAIPAEVAISTSGDIMLRYEADDSNQFDSWAPLV